MSPVREAAARVLKPATLIALALVALLAAMNRHQPFLWWLFAVLSCATVVGLVWPKLALRKLRVSRTLPEVAVEGERVSVDVRVTNGGLLARYLIEVRDVIPMLGAARGSRSGEPVVLGQVSRVPGRGELTFGVSLLCEKRGNYQLGPASLWSAFPLGVLEARRVDGNCQSLLVRPRTFHIARLPLAGAHRLIHRGDLLMRGKDGTEYRGLREYRPGDPVRHIHWPSSARSGQLVVREHDPIAAALVTLVIDCDAGRNIGRGKEASFEYSVRAAASIALFSRNNGIPVRLVAMGNVHVASEFDTGERYFELLLDELAMLEPEAAPGTFALALTELAARCEPGETVFVFPGAGGGLAAEMQALAVLRARGARVNAVECDVASFGVAIPTEGATPRLADLVHASGGHVFTLRQGDDPVEEFSR